MSIADKLLYLDETKTKLKTAINLRGGTIAGADTFRSYVDQLQQLIWLPDVLFANGEQGAWYDPSDLSTLFQDAAGTIPVTAAGDPVGRMLDKSGRGNHLVQPTAAARPTYHTDGAVSWLSLDGVDDTMITIGPLAYGSNQVVITCAMSTIIDWRSPVLSSGNSLSATGTQQWTIYNQREASTKEVAYASYPGDGSVGSYVVLTSPNTVPAPATSVISAVVTASGAAVRYGGITVNSTEYTTRQQITVFSAKPLVLGNDRANYARMKFRGAVIRVGVVADINIIEKYLAEKAGVTL